MRDTKLVELRITSQPVHSYTVQWPQRIHPFSDSPVSRPGRNFADATHSGDEGVVDNNVFASYACVGLN
jgi:hypothetical protein